MPCYDHAVAATADDAAVDFAVFYADDQLQPLMLLITLLLYISLCSYTLQSRPSASI